MDFNPIPPGYVHPDHMAPHTEDYHREAFGDTAVDPDWDYDDEDEQDVDAMIAQHEMEIHESDIALDLEPPF